MIPAALRHPAAQEAGRSRPRDPHIVIMTLGRIY